VSGFVVFSVFLVFGMTVFGLVFYQVLDSARQLRGAYRRLAVRFHGRCDPGGLFVTPRAWFVYKGTSVLVDMQRAGSRRGEFCTQCHLNWPDRDFRCEIHPAGAFLRMKHFLGMKDVEIGSADFDRDYFISGSDVRALKLFLSPTVQATINELRSIGTRYHTFQWSESDFPIRGGQIYIAAGGGRILIRKFGYSGEFRMLERFVQLSLELYDHAIATLSTGIDFVEVDGAAKLNLAEAVCQICGEPIESDVVFCRSCKTPHHLECWKYYGACSTYGCGQKRYVLPRKTVRS